MDFSIATLLANFADDKLVAQKVLQKKMDCDDPDSVRRLEIALDALERSGFLAKERGKYRRITEDGIIEGKLRCSSKGFCFAIQDAEGSDDIYVRESHLNTAWNGDRVLVEVTKEGSRRRSPEGEVRLILERANTSVLARVKGAEGQFQAVPLDDRLLFELDLPANGENKNLEEAVDQLAHVEIVRYPLGQHPPQGKVAQILGSDAEAASDLDIVCCKHDLPRTFSEDVLTSTKSLPTKVRKVDLRKRLDLRKQLTITLDGATAKTIDDALTLEKTDEGYWKLGVHISDVAHYIEPQSSMDREAQKRGISIYLADTILPMVPEALSSKLCHLTPGQDRLTISVLVTLDEQGEVLEFELQPSVIKVDHQLNYQEAQAILERNNPEALEKLGISADQVDAFRSIHELLDQLLALSEALTAKRHERGAFELNLPEHVFPEDEEGEDERGNKLSEYFSNKFVYDDEGALGAIVVSSLSPARLIVTESMILANQLVASHLKALGLPGIYRVHRTPDLSDVQELIKLAANMEIELVPDDEENIHSRDYQRFTELFKESDSEKILTYLLLSTLKPAVYTVNPGPHFGLALEYGYTHFTDPLRRYPDLLIHRVLHALFAEGRDRRSSRSKERVNLRHSSCHGLINWNVLPPDLHHALEETIGSLTIYLSEREKLAQEAEADLEGLKKAEFMQAHTGGVFHGLITGVQSYGFFVELAELLVEGLVHVSSLKDDWYEYRSRQQKLVGRKNRKQYQLGDQVEVQVKSVDYYRQQIDLVAVGGGSQASDDDEDLTPDAEGDDQDDLEQSDETNGNEDNGANGPEEE